MKKLFTFIVVLFLSVQLFAQTNVTFNVDLNDSITSGWFNPDVDSVFMAGTIFDPAWQEPGTDLQTLMEDIDEDGIYTLELSGIADGSYEYKYFKATTVAPTWSDGEWEGGDNRTLDIPVVKTTVIVDDVFGDITAHNVSVGINEIENKFVNIYPNPSNGIFALSSEFDFEVMNISGKVVLIGKGNSINLSDFASGMYIVKLSTVEGTLVQKLIVE